MKKSIRLIMVMLAGIILLSSGTVAYSQSSGSLTANGVTKYAIGASYSSAEVDLLVGQLFFNPNYSEEDIITVDGNLIDKYLNDGSDETTGVYSSARVEILDENYKGVQVLIGTPQNITDITESMYQNAAIAAGATRANIMIVSLYPVTGEGALAGVYEIFSQEGLDLDPEDIKNAENQIKIEQSLSNETDLSESDISRLITKLNLTTINNIQDNNILSVDDASELVKFYLDSNGYDFSDDLLNILTTHVLNFSQSSAAKDPDTKEALEQTLSQYKSMDNISQQAYDIGYGHITVDEVEIIPGEADGNVANQPVIGITFSVSLNEDVEPITAFNAIRNSTKVIQDNDPNTINQLNGSNPITREFLANSNNLIKPGGTTQMGLAYRTDDFSTPIEIYFYENQYQDTDHLGHVIIPIEGLVQ